MQIVSYNRKELQAFIETDFYDRLNKVPISRHRAISHIHNPFCDDEDVLLWVAYEGEKLLGYSSVLPDRIVQNDREDKIYWSSSVWRDESPQQSTLAATLLLQVIAQYKNRFFMTGFIPEVEKPYQKMRIFQPIQTNWGCSFYRNLVFSQAIKKRFPKLKRIVSFYSFFEKCFNFTLFFGRKLTRENFKTKVSIVENNIFDAEFDAFIKSYCIENHLVIRNSTYFDWVLNYPWVLQGKSNRESQRYYFSSISEQFECHSVKIYDKQQLIGFMLLKIRDKRLTVSFSYLKDNCVKDAANYILIQAKLKNLNTITVYDNKLIPVFKKQRTKYIWCRKIKKKYFFPCHFDITSSVFQEGDGDEVFT